MIRRLARAPIVHFLGLGALVFAFSLWATKSAPPSRPDRIVIAAKQLERIKQEHLRRTGSAPTDAELDALIESEVLDELLYRRALLLGLDQGDRSIRWRLINKMRFVERASDRTEAELHEDALALGLDREDIVVRRILIQNMRLLIQSGAKHQNPSDAQLREFFELHRGDYMQPARSTFTHIFFSHQKRGGRAKALARETLVRLGDRTERGRQAWDRGDVFALGHEFHSSSGHQLQKLFGEAFAKEIERVPIGRWSGPLPSAYGQHLVYLDSRSPEGPPDLETVRSQVVQRMRRERREQHFQNTMRELRSQYPVSIEGEV